MVFRVCLLFAFWCGTALGSQIEPASLWLGVGVVKETANAQQCLLAIESLGADVEFIGYGQRILKIVVSQGQEVALEGLSCLESLEVGASNDATGVAGVTN